MKCRICKQYVIGNSCGHYEPYNIYAENTPGGYVLIQKIGSLRAKGRLRLWKPTKGMFFTDSNQAYDKAWEIRNSLEYKAI